MLYKMISINKVESEKRFVCLHDVRVLVCHLSATSGFAATNQNSPLSPDQTCRSSFNKITSNTELLQFSAGDYRSHTDWNCFQHCGELNVCLDQNHHIYKLTETMDHLHNWAWYGPDQTATTTQQQQQHNNNTTQQGVERWHIRHIYINNKKCLSVLIWSKWPLTYLSPRPLQWRHNADVFSDKQI